MSVRRLARFRDRDHVERIGEVLGVGPDGGVSTTSMVQPLGGDVLSPLEPSGPAVPLTSVTLLAPVRPTKVIGIGTNYRKHAEEMGKPVPAVPKVFLKPPTAVVGPGRPIVLPPGTERVDHEAELGVVLGRPASRVSPEHALEYVAGYVVVNDVTARDFQRADGVFGRAKGFDSFCPIGPWLTQGVDPADLRVWATVDGELRQNGRTSDLVFDVATLISFVSSVMTLIPGDVIATGTPSGVGPLLPGQVVRVGVDGVGAFENPVVARDDRA